MSQGRSHIPSFRATDLPPGFGDCIECGQRITREQWVTATCPGRPVDTDPAMASAMIREAGRLLVFLATGVLLGGGALLFFWVD